VATAAEDNDNIKAVYMLDPWCWPESGRILAGGIKLRVPFQIIASEEFLNDPMHEAHGYDPTAHIRALIDNSLGSKYQYIGIKELHHLHQMDVWILANLEITVNMGQFNGPHRVEEASTVCPHFT